MYKKIISDCEVLAEKYCQRHRKDPLLWSDHTRLVRKYALILADREGADSLVVELAALMHDTGKFAGREDHHLVASQLMQSFLNNWSLPEVQKQLILKCIEKHRSRFSGEENEIEVKVVQSADMLGRIMDGSYVERLIQKGSKEKLVKWLKRANSKINLSSALEIATPTLKRVEKVAGL